MTPKVGIIISNYNGWQDTLACLDSLQKQTFRDFEVILLDDASTNDSVEQLSARLPEDVIFLPHRENLGFSASNNLGIRRALEDGVEWVLLLNNDTVCAPDMLETLLAQTPENAVSCPKMLFLDEPDRIWFAGGRLNPRTGHVRHLGGHAKDGPEVSRRQPVNFITFCCVLLPRQVVEQVGFLNEELFMYCEDVEYCIRLADAGVKMWYLPDARLWHRAGGSISGMLAVYYITRNTLSLRCRGRSRAYRRLVGSLAVARGAVSMVTAGLCGHRKGRSYGYYHGALDFLKGRTGRMDPGLF